MLNSRLLGCTFAAIALSLAAFCIRAEPAIATLPDIGRISLAVEGNRVKARVAHDSVGSPARSHVVSLDKPLQTRLRRATELVVLAGRGFTDDGRTFFILGVATPSVQTPGAGFCGAGTEDFLLLIEWKDKPRRLELRDPLQVQSCLQSMVLASDQGSDLLVVLHGVDDPAKVVLSWLQHLRYGAVTRTLTVSRGAFVLAP